MATTGAGSSKNEMLLNDPPTDGISSVCFAPSSDLLLASSWDSVRVFFFFIVRVLIRVCTASTVRNRDHTSGAAG